MSEKQKHTRWPAELWAEVQAFAKDMRRRTGDRYADDCAIRDLVRLGLKEAARRAKRRKT